MREEGLRHQLKESSRSASNEYQTPCIRSRQRLKGVMRLLA